MKPQLIGKNFSPNLKNAGENGANPQINWDNVIDVTLWILGTLALGIYLMFYFIARVLTTTMDDR